MARSKRINLSPQERSLLEEILLLTWQSGRLVDGTNFRITHRSDRRMLQDLEFRALLGHERNVDAYCVRLLGLDALQSTTSRKILALGDTLAKALQDRFSNEESRRKEFRVAEIADCFGTNIDECLLVLLHLKDAVENWWGGSSADWPSKDAWMLPSERVFDWPSIADLIRQFQDWNSPHRRAMKDSLRAATLMGRVPAPSGTSLAPVPEWHRDIRTRPLRALLGEIHRARQVKCAALVVLGLRAALDTMCNEKWGDLGSFEIKLKKLHDEGFIGREQHEQIAAAIAIGNATTHRGHVPSRRDAETIHEIVEGLIRQHYSLRVRATAAAQRIPARVKAKKVP